MKQRDPDAMSPLARAIHRRMTDLSKTQKGLALEAGLSATYVRDLYDGTKRSPTIDKLQAIAKVLRCTVGDLLGETDIARSDDASRRLIAQQIYDVLVINLAMMVDQEIAKLDRRSMEDMATALTQTIMETALGHREEDLSNDEMVRRAVNVIDLYQARQHRSPAGR